MIYLVLFGIISGAPTGWMLRDDASWPRVFVAVLLGIVTGVVAGFVIGTLLAGGKPQLALSLGILFGPLAAVVAAKRSYAVHRTPNDMRN
jgi:uncharacterized membrane protein YeaQ/YmgE (transglycosylase-associated protein family)